VIAAAASAPQAQAPSGGDAFAHSNSRVDAAKRPRDEGAEKAPANEGKRGASATRDARAAGSTARHGEAPVDEDQDAPAFAELLAANAAGDAGAAAAREPADEVEAPVAAADLPDRLLSLLAGTWAAVPGSAPATTDPLAGAGASSGKATPAALPGLATMATAPAPASGDAGNASGAAADAAGSDAAIAALAKVAGDAAAAPVDATANTATDTLQPAAALQALGQVANNARPVSAVPGTAMPMPANPEAGFDDGFGARIAWMAEQRLGHAEIRLNPEHIGPIEVRVQLDGTRVTAEFHSAHAEVRQAIEASVPRLREMLGQQGLQLGHADVGQRHAQGQGQAAGGRRGRSDEPGADRHGDGPANVVPASVRSRGLLDEYA